MIERSHMDDFCGKPGDPRLYQRSDGDLYEIIGWIDRPAAILRRVRRPHEIEMDSAAGKHDCHCQMTVVAGSPQAGEFTRLVLQEPSK